MSLCPACASKLTKRKSDMTWNCKRHGVVRHINTPPPSGPMREDIVNANYDKMDDIATYVPEHMRDSYKMWVEHGILPGSFGTALLSNDLVETVRRADRVNGHCINSTVAWFCNFAPSDCYGSREKVRAWAESKRPKALANFE